MLLTCDPKEEVIVYCSNFGCTASILVYQQLVDHGFQNLSITSITRFRSAPQSPNVRHNAGGCARSLEPLPTLYLASEANVISLVEM